ncbi:hydroxysqualene dehydroxylase HpnE [Pseudonocardia sp.]|uniref:hydroxysqualene dehydroxylase HpnE n=1 Tax=Pseudonocardia sp. TaxID=60912 RepID=UPI002624BDC2|nr:hydroxysqualene dehydroxylase HpnE [Pseudonocardia sp.]MCW2717173.1 squalene-associated FAD-dependent desaturase [Pseudonocardia sp.]
MRTRIGVVGGGLAGITAALRCADAGAEVTLFEGRSRLGGVAGSFRRAAGDGVLDVDTGQHVFLRCCSAYRGLLDRLGVADLVTLQDRLDIPVHGPGARPGRLRRTGLPAPLHMGAALLGHRPLPLRDRLRLGVAALALRGVDAADPATDAQSFGAWLGAHGQSPRAVDTLWDLVGIATLNERARGASLALAATVFQLGLLTDAAAGDIGWARVPLGRLHDEAARRALREAGVAVRTSTKVRSLHPADQGWQIEVEEEELVMDGVICAVPPPAAHTLLPDGALDLPPGWVEGLGSSPIVNVHVVYDRTVLNTPFAAGIDTPVQWVFDRTGQSGLHRVHPAPAQYLAVSLSAADDVIGEPVAVLRERMLPALVALLPAARDAEVLEFFVTREPHATFRPAPGTAALRPPARTALPGLAVAGAWTATGWPATMEGAVRSGEAAADVLCGSAARTRMTSPGRRSPRTTVRGAA